MKKKMLAVALSATMVITSLSGCGKDKSSYFGEFKEMTDIATGTATTEVSITGKMPVDDEAYDIIADADGNMNVNLKIESKTESAEKSAVVISTKLGKETEYSEVTTIVYTEETLYLNVKPMIDLIGKYDESKATEISTTLSTFGITDYASIKVNDYIAAVEGATGESMNFDTAAYEDDAKIFGTELCDVLAKDFEGISGKEKDGYTLTFNEDNAGKALEGLVKLINEDSETVYDSYVKFAKAMYGEDAETVKELEESKEDVIAELKDSVTDITDNKDEYLETIKKNGIAVTSKINVTGKEGKRKSNVSLNATMNGSLILGEISSNVYTLTMTQTYEEGEISIDDMIPENSADVTTLLTGLMSLGSGEGADTGDDLKVNDEPSEDEDDTALTETVYSGDYVVTLAGKEIEFPCDVDTLKKAGYDFVSEEEEIVDAEGYTMTSMMNNDDAISVYIRNDNSYEIPVEDGIVCGVNIYSDTDLKLSSGLTYKSSKSEFLSQYGEPTLTSGDDDVSVCSWYEENSMINGLSITFDGESVAYMELVTGLE